MNWKSPLRENLESLIFPLILVLITRTFVFQAFKIPSESMLDTLLVGDHILVNKSIFLDPIPGLNLSLFPVRSPQREDILVFKFPDEPNTDYIKRLIGLGGETIDVTRPSVFIDGKKIDDSRYAVYRPKYFSPRDGRWKIEPDQYFMMGDNRDNSADSRAWKNHLTRDKILGKAFIVYFSWDSKTYDEEMKGRSGWAVPWYFIKNIRFGRFLNKLH